MSLIPLIAVVGPTASGKTRLAVDIALKYGGEVVSADSMQIYSGMDIGTAKPTQEEKKGVPHHMLSIVQPYQSFSVANYVTMARQCIADINARGHLPILAGGTGLYVTSLVSNINYGETFRDETLREELKELAQREGGQALLELLHTFDPESAQRLHPNNLSRIIRAIEVFKTSGVTITEQQRLSKQNPSPYKTCIIGLYTSDRTLLYEQINKRVDMMLEAGLAREVKELIKTPNIKDSTAMQAIGYKELVRCLNGEESYDVAVENIKRGSRHYAKRQLTWFRRDESTAWLDVSTLNYENICKQAIDIIDKCLYL